MAIMEDVKSKYWGLMLLVQVEWWSAISQLNHSQRLVLIILVSHG